MWARAIAHRKKEMKMIIVDLNFILIDINGNQIIKKYDENKEPIYFEAWDCFSENIEKHIETRRKRGQIELANAWGNARNQFMLNKKARLTFEEHDYVKLFLTENVIDWVGTIKAQFLSAFNEGENNDRS